MSRNRTSDTSCLPPGRERAPNLVAWALLFAIGVVGWTSACGGDGAEAADRVAEGAPAAVSLATAEFDVEGMTCGGCALATELALKKLDGVARADARYDERTGEGRCTVEYDPARVGPERMIAAIRDLGYEPTLLDAKADG